MSTQTKNTVRIEYMRLADLLSRFWERNAKRHDLDTIQASFSRFGFVAPPIIDEATGKLVAGHGRCETLGDARANGDAPPEGVHESDGDWLVPVLRGKAFASIDEASAYGIADNQVGVGDGSVLEAMWNGELLAEALQNLHDGPGLLGTGFDDDSLANLLEALGQGVPPKEDEFDLDAALDNLPEPRIKRGEVWQLGRHRLMCGDSTSEADVAKLMGGEKADMGLTSPPYAVGKEYEEGQTFEEHLALLRAIAKSGLAVIKAGGFFFVNFDEIAPQSHTKPLTGSTRQCLYPISKDYWQIWHCEFGYDLYAERTWYKPFNRLQQPFWTYHTSIPHHQEWEHLWTWRLPGGEGDQVFDWDISVHAIWDTRQEATDDKPLTRHVAAFPVGIPERALRAHSAVGALVWEPFCGSGTTIIAAEQLGRICYGMEIEPRYCEVAIQRWENYTGQKAELAE